MDNRQKYWFDLTGYLIVPNLLTAEEAAQLLQVTDGFHDHVATHLADEPQFDGHYGIRYHFDREFGCSSYITEAGGGPQVIVDDCLNVSPAYDLLVNHEPTMAYVRELVTDGRPTISGSELRYRHPNNHTPTHMGGPIDPRSKYEFAGRPVLDTIKYASAHRDFNLLSLRVVYALHDIPMENGPVCCVPGSHKANFPSPFGNDPLDEPGMVGLTMKAGDVLFFTENMRHGGLPNQADWVRRTIHLTFMPNWVGSVSPAHWDGFVYVTPEAWARYSPEQRALFNPRATEYPPA